MKVIYGVDDCKIYLLPTIDISFVFKYVAIEFLSFYIEFNWSK